MQTTEAARYQLQFIPKAGQFLMYVDLTALERQSISEALTLLEVMGYQPELRYQGTKERLRLCALLRDEQFDPTQPIADDYRLSERIALFEAFPGDEMAVCCSNGLPAKVAA